VVLKALDYTRQAAQPAASNAALDSRVRAVLPPGAATVDAEARGRRRHFLPLTAVSPLARLQAFVIIVLHYRILTALSVQMSRAGKIYRKFARVQARFSIS
jgi:hypothetical protein